MSASIVLGKKLVSRTSRPYIIAEIGVNHEGSLDQAKRLIDQAKQGGGPKQAPDGIFAHFPDPIRAISPSTISQTGLLASVRRRCA
jgi:hypothetical protein